jgi:hypothetical protein
LLQKIVDIEAQLEAKHLDQSDLEAQLGAKDVEQAALDTELTDRARQQSEFELQVSLFADLSAQHVELCTKRAAESVTEIAELEGALNDTEATLKIQLQAAKTMRDQSAKVEAELEEQVGKLKAELLQQGEAQAAAEIQLHELGELNAVAEAQVLNLVEKQEAFAAEAEALEAEIAKQMQQ